MKIMVFVHPRLVTRHGTIERTTKQGRGLSADVCHEVLYPYPLQLAITGRQVEQQFGLEWVYRE
jgi:hypothetical protein